MGRTSDARENIINGAIELIGLRSYNAVGVQQLCEHAGVKKGSFYHFFPSKRELTLVALDRMWAGFKEGILDPVYNLDISAIDKFHTLLKKSQEHQDADKDCKGCVTGCSIGNLALELSTQDEVIRVKIEEIFREWTQYFEKLIKDSISEGDLPDDTDPERTAEAILVYIEGIFLLSKAFNDSTVMSRLGEGVLQICIRKQKIKTTA